MSQYDQEHHQVPSSLSEVWAPSDKERDQKRKRDKLLLTLVQGLRSLQRCAALKRNQLRELNNNQRALLRELQELDIRQQVMIERLSQATIDVTPEFYKKHNISRLDTRKINLPYISEEKLDNTVHNLHLVPREYLPLSRSWMPSGLDRLSKEQSIGRAAILAYLNQFKNYWCSCGIAKKHWQQLFEKFLMAAHHQKK